jgi:hypothetical protein
MATKPRVLHKTGHLRLWASQWFYSMELVLVANMLSLCPICLCIFATLFYNIPNARHAFDLLELDGKLNRFFLQHPLGLPTIKEDNRCQFHTSARALTDYGHAEHVRYINWCSRQLSARGNKGTPPYWLALLSHIRDPPTQPVFCALPRSRQ